MPPFWKRLLGLCKQLFSKKFVACLYVLCALPICVWSWGYKAHRVINQNAYFYLPNPLACFYHTHKEYLILHAVDADKRKRFQKKEAPKHYFNLDFLDVVPFDHIPRTYENALAHYGLDTLLHAGILPWQILLTMHDLTLAFQTKQRSKILSLIADLGHYVADATVPLHVTQNHNGQLTNQEGIHALWESKCVQKMYFDTNRVVEKPITYVANPCALVWNILLESYQGVPQVLRTERQLTARFGSQAYSLHRKHNRIQKSYKAAFVKEYLSLNETLIRQRMDVASRVLAALIYTSWVDAGNPLLP